MITSHNIATLTAGPGVARVSVRATIGFPDLVGDIAQFDLYNSQSCARMDQLTLSNGNNDITVPDSAGAVIIVPPTDNAQIITLKGVNGDTGVALHSTAPSLLTLRESVSSFVLNVTASVANVKLVWL